MTTSTRNLIDNFLTQKRLAFVGVSRDPKNFSRTLFREFQKQGFDVVPVNPNATEVEGVPCVATVQDISPPVESAYLMTSPDITDQVIHDCAAAGITQVWMHRGEGVGAVSQDALEFCRANGINVVPGFCAFMFLPNAGFFHKAHGFVMKLTGAYPN